MGQRFLALASLLLLGAAAIAMTPSARGALRIIVVACCLLAGWGLTRSGPGAAIAVMVGALCGIAVTGLAWQAVMPLAVLAFAGVAFLSPRLGSIRPADGRVPFWGTLLCAAVTPVALSLWLQLGRSDISDLVALIPKAPLPLLVLGGVTFALVNAFFEELIWRGLFQSRLVQLFGAPWAIGIQAVSFGVAHAHGFPRGLTGVLLAGVWAVMLGILRQRACGLAAPVLAHVVADATIACLVISAAR